MLSKCPCCSGALLYQKTTIKEEFYKVNADGSIDKTPLRAAVNTSWSKDESGLVCTNCGFTTIPTQTTDYFKVALQRAERR